MVIFRKEFAFIEINKKEYDHVYRVSFKTQTFVA